MDTLYALGREVFKPPKTTTKSKQIQNYGDDIIDSNGGIFLFQKIHNEFLLLLHDDNYDVMALIWLVDKKSF